MTRPRKISLALQGGGSHGAFTWGVLDALLEDGRFEVGAVTGTSAGALNAAVLACGLARGGPAAAREALRRFWHDIGGCRDPFGPGRGHPALGGSLARFNQDGQPWYEWTQWWLNWLSPYQFNPLGLDALGDVLRRHLDDEALAALPLPVFVAATSVRTGEPRIFSGRRLTVQALLASACLPQLFRAVEIDLGHGPEPFWDGGFVANPALWPLYGTGLLDIVLVQLDPLLHHGTPHTLPEINDRLNEITFNANLVDQLRAIEFVARLLKEEKLDAKRYRRLRLHRIADDAALAPLNASSKTNTDPALLEALFELGRVAARHWLAADARLVGHRASFDIAAMLRAARRGDATA